MKSVLISIQPKWCELIASGKKTVEVRKTKPKLKTPFKVYIYCTKAKDQFLQSHNNIFFYCEITDFIGGHGAGLYKRLNGTVIGEFVCDKVDRIARCGTCNRDISLKIVDENLYCKELDYAYLDKCQLSYSDINEYSNGGGVYGWHISNLVIYDKPKELSEFSRVCNGDCQNCKYAIWTQPRGWCDESIPVACKTIKPPQSWCYVESEVDTE